ncbi:MAG TPA: hypothetical protein PK723_02890 [Candidatus Pacearchaeota archaeon]|nr:hypothetical protein [Candidatus Pacearchaeota archaeon]
MSILLKGDVVIIDIEDFINYLDSLSNKELKEKLKKFGIKFTNNSIPSKYIRKDILEEPIIYQQYIIYTVKDKRRFKIKVEDKHYELISAIIFDSDKETFYAYTKQCPDLFIKINKRSQDLIQPYYAAIVYNQYIIGLKGDEIFIDTLDDISNIEILKSNNTDYQNKVLVNSFTDTNIDYTRKYEQFYH